MNADARRLERSLELQGAGGVQFRMPLDRRGSGVVADINVTPMVDVMLVLLIIFMVVTPMLDTRIPVELAKARNPHPMQDADREDAVVVAIKHDGSVYLRSEKTAISELAPRVRDLLAVRTDKTVYIKSDARAKYKAVVEVVDNVRSAGVDAVGLLTDKIPPGLRGNRHGYESGRQ